MKELISALKRLVDPIERVCGRIVVTPGSSAGDDAEFESKHPRSHGKFAKSNSDIKPTGAADPNFITTVNGINDRDKFERIAADFKAHGWNCRPVLAWSDDGKRWIAYTGSHRTFAARAAGIDVPVFEIPSSAMQKAFAILRRNGENPKRLKDNTNEVNSLWMFKKLADEYGLKEFEIPKMLMEIEVK